MQPSEPARSETSLELTFSEPEIELTPSTDLVLPPSDPPPMPAPATEPDTAPPGPLGDLVAAHFRRVEVAMLGRVLITTLSGALPASMVRVEHRRTFGKRLLGRAGEAIGISVTAGDRTLTFRAPEVGVSEASVSHTVRGVVLSTTGVPVAQWLEQLGVLLDRLTSDDEATRTALEQALTR